MDVQVRELVKLNDFHGESFDLLDTLYIGGGTPSLLKPDKMKQLLDNFSKVGLSLNSNYEFTIEIDPGTFNLEELEAWKELGVNRFSLGVQAYNEKYLRLLDRRHDLSEVTLSLEYLSKTKSNFSVDLIIGTPESEARDLIQEIEQLSDFSPSHFSVYILSTRLNYPLKEKLPDEEKIRDDYLEVSRQLEKLGFHHYEVSNFAKTETMESVHNKKYWDYESVAAVGPNATGTICKPDKVFRYQWKSLSGGFQTEEVKGESLILEKLFLALRRSKSFNLQSILGMNISQQYLKTKVENWHQLGYVEPGSDLENLKITPLGFLMNDSMLGDLMDII
tara:strand:- start:3275 stop:4276 length:1002 start_codon:yes stop_codon:yes gene_type:complete